MLSGETDEEAPDRIAIDAETLREVIPGLERLEAMYNAGLQEIRPAKRGYFTPDEDDRVRQLLLTYRNYRIATWDLLWRYREYYKRPVTRDNLRGFLVGYAAALKLYEKSLKVIDVVEYEPMLRAKLNEPDRKFELEADFFEGVLRSYSSISNYFRMIAASAYFARHRRDFELFGLEQDGQVGWLLPIIEATRGVLSGKFLSVLRRRIKHDWRAACALLIRPVAFVRYRSQATVASAIAAIHVTPGHRNAIGEPQIRSLRETLTSGDVLLMRADDKATAALLPGFWSHAALYIGDWTDMERLGLDQTSAVSKLRWVFERYPSWSGYVIEAVAQGCRVHKLHASLHADHAAVLRPRLDAAERRAGLLEAFSHTGKPYDFEFDFNSTTRIVCTELVYRSYHGRGEIGFQLAKRIGRYTLTADDIARQILDKPSGNGFELIDLYLRLRPGPADRIDAGERLRRFADTLKERPN